MRSLSLAGADRFRTTSCWRRNAISASRAACDLNSPTSNPPSSFKRPIIPAMRVAHRGSCASQDMIFGSHTVNVEGSGTQTVMLSADAQIYGVEKRRLSDIKLGDFVASGGTECLVVAVWPAAS